MLSGHTRSHDPRKQEPSNQKHEALSILHIFLVLYALLLGGGGAAHSACGILASLGIEPMAPAVEMQSPNHWTTREFPT